MKKAIYAGSFDPITKGHMDVVEQALCVFDEVIIAIGTNPKKTRFLDTDTSVRLIRDVVAYRGLEYCVRVCAFQGALVTFAENNGVDAIVRGMRQISDFNQEFTEHGINSRLTDLPICYFICKTDYLHVSSSSVREMASLGLDYQWAVDPPVSKLLESIVI